MKRSSVYRLTLLASLAFCLVAILLGGLLAAANFAAIDEREEEELLDTYHWLSEFVEEEGLAALAEEFAEEDEWLLPDEDGFYLFEEEEFAFLILDSRGEALMGLPMLAGAEPGLSWREFYFEEPEEWVEARVYSGELVGERSLIVARSRSWEYYITHDNLGGGLFWLLIISVPLSLVIAYALSRRVHSRLDELASVVGQIGQGSMAQRAAVSERNDEFDQLAGHINAMLDRLEALHRNIESVSVGVAHDIKTPLSRVSNRLQLMRQDMADPAAMETHLGAAEQQLQTVMQTFGNLLRLSEIEAGDRRSQFKPVDLSVLVTDLVDSYQPVFADAGRQLECALRPGLMVQGDEGLLLQMLSNLLENSIEHGRPGGHTWIHAQSHSSGILVQVGDDGPGIPQEHRDRIFERFYRADASRSKPGNGLGLAIVFSITQLHDARIELLEGQEGAVFDCLFPTSGQGEK